jgi:glucose/arabinose dehydrogenase
MRPPIRATSASLLVICAATALGSGCALAQSAPEYVATDGLTLELVTQAADHPVHLTAPAGDSRLFLVEQPGRVRVLENGRFLPRPFLDLTERVSSGGERGLLSLAFHPRYAENGLFYVNYTDTRGDTRVERYRVSSDRDRADPSSAELVLYVKQPYANHNGGHVLFGPDGMLYVAMGDGGSGGDPHGNGQNKDALLGKLLRLDVDHGRPYAIPRDNPFRGGGGRAEIWAYGLRNPWRIAFDPPTHLLYIADVGQNQWEEIDVMPAGRGGFNYGWNWMEGNHRFRSGSGRPSGLVVPLVEYDHGEGCSITGGVVYRGKEVPALVGHYLFSDYCSGWVRSFRVDGTRAVEFRQWKGLEAGAVTSFGVDGAGELYVLSAPNRVFRVRAAEGSRRG